MENLKKQQIANALRTYCDRLRYVDNVEEYTCLLRDTSAYTEPPKAEVEEIKINNEK